MLKWGASKFSLLNSFFLYEHDFMLFFRAKQKISELEAAKAAMKVCTVAVLQMLRLLLLYLSL